MGDLSGYILVLVSNLIPLDHRYTWNYLNPCKFVESCFMARMLSILKNAPHHLRKRCVSSSSWGWCYICWWDQKLKILFFKTSLSSLILLTSYFISYWEQSYFAYVFYVLFYKVHKFFWWMDHIITMKYLIFPVKILSSYQFFYWCSYTYSVGHYLYYISFFHSFPVNPCLALYWRHILLLRFLLFYPVS